MDRPQPKDADEIAKLLAERSWLLRGELPRTGPVMASPKEAKEFIAHRLPEIAARLAELGVKK